MDLIRRTDWIDPDSEASLPSGKRDPDWLVLWLVLLILVCFAWLAVVPSPYFIVRTGLVLLPASFFFLLVVGYLGEARATRELRQYLRERMDIPGEVPQYGVAVIYKRKGIEYGRDAGVAVFQEGVLDFAGANSHFSIPVAPRPGYSGLHLFKSSGFRSTIDQGEYQATVYIEFHNKVHEGRESQWSGLNDVAAIRGVGGAPNQIFLQRQWSTIGDLLTAPGAATPPNPLFYLPPSYPDATAIKDRNSRLMVGMQMTLLMPVLVALAYLSDAEFTASAVCLIGLVVIGWHWAVLRGLRKRRRLSRQVVQSEVLSGSGGVEAEVVEEEQVRA